MPRAEEIAKVMAEMDRFNQPRATVVEERYEKRVASVGASYGGLTELMSQGRPGNWASDHKAEAEKYAGWHYVAISAIGKAIRSCDVEAYQEPSREYSKAYNSEDDDSAPLPKWHPLMKLLKRPSASQSGASFREEVAIQLCLTGSALIWNVPNQMGRTVERYVIPTAIAEPRQPEKGLPKGGWYINPEVARWQIESGWFLYTGLAQAIGKVIDARDIQVIRFIHPVFKDEGQSPVSAGALWTDTSEKIDVSRHAHLRNGSDPSVIIGIDGVEDESTLQRMSAKFNEKYAGPSKHGKAMFVNGQNVKVEPVTRTPAEMAYEGAFAQFRDAIMALHGVTPIAAGIEAPSGDDGLYAPLKQFIQGTVQPILDLMAEEDTEQLATQFGEGLTIFYTAKAIDDAKLTEQQINTDIAAGAIEVDEIRKLRGRKPWGGEKGKAVAGQGPKQEGPGGLPGLPQGVPGLDPGLPGANAPKPPAGPQASAPGQSAQPAKTPEQIAEEAVAKALAAFEDRISGLLKSGDNCGTGAGGFQEGNTCGQRRAKKGGQVGMNGEFYAGGQFLPSTDMPKRVRSDMQRIASGKSKIDEGQFEKLEPGEFAPYEMIGTFLVMDGRNSEGKLQVKQNNDTALAYLGLGPVEVGQLQNIANRFNTGERRLSIFDYPALVSAKDIIRALNANFPIPESMLPRLQGNLAKYVTRNGEASERKKSGSDCGANGPGGGGFQAGNTCARGDGESSGKPKRGRKKKTESSAKKEVWEMSPDEYRKEENSRIVDAVKDSVAYTWNRGASRQVVEPDTLRVGKDGEIEILRREKGALLKDKPKWQKLPDAEREALAKEVQVGWSEENRVWKQTTHEAEVERAISEGKPVPPEAYSSYPDLAQEMRYRAQEDKERASQAGRGERGSIRFRDSLGLDNTEEIQSSMDAIAEDRDPDSMIGMLNNVDAGDHDKLAEYASLLDRKYGKWVREQIDSYRNEEAERDARITAERERYQEEHARKDKKRSKKKSLSKAADGCGANAQGGGGFQPGNTCGKRDGSAGESQGGDALKVNSKVLAWAKEKFADEKVAENFARWFGDSKVVDDDGNPQIVYHGTNKRSAEKVRESGFLKRKEGFVAAFFASDSGRAEGYAVSFDENWNEVKDGVIVPVYISMKNPKVYTTEYQFPLTKEGIEVLKRDGYDGLSAGNVFVPFEPTQIKSATGNSGTFDPDNPNITKSAPSEGYRPPVSAQSNARKVLRWKREHGDAVQGMTATGWARARQLASGKKVSRETVGRMAAFARHRKNSKVNPKFRAEPWRDAGYVAWLGWGGDSGINWAAGIVAGEGKSGSDCGANQPGGGGFRAGNTCGKEDGGSGESGSSKIRQWAEKKFKDKQTAENFVKWFGDSKVVDENGEPLVMYHGAEDYRGEVDGIFVTDDPAMATRYAELKAVERAVSENSELEEIVYEVMGEEGADTLTDLGPERVKEIAEANGFEIPDAEGKVDSLWVRSVNPLDLREYGSDVGDVGELWDSMHQAGLLDDSWDSLDEEARYEVESQYDGKALYNFLEDEGIQAKAFKRGYDSVVFVDIAPDGGATHDSWLVKEGNQVKSDRNSGKFSRESKDVTKSASGCGANAQGGGGFQPGNTCAREDGGEGGAGESKPVNREKRASLVLSADERKEIADQGLYLHGTEADFDEFKQGGHKAVYFSDPKEYSNRTTQAEHIGEYRGHLLAVKLDDSKLKYFDPYNDKKAHDILKQVTGKDSKQIDYTDMPEIVAEAEKFGYNKFRVYEPAVQGFSIAITEPSAAKIVRHLVKAGDSERSKSGSDCGANAEGGGGFQPGNTCGREDGAESGGEGADKKVSRQQKQKENRIRERLYLEAELMRATGWTAEELATKTESLNSAKEIDSWMRDELAKLQTGKFAEARAEAKPYLDKLRAKVVEVYEKDMDKINALNAELKAEADKHDKLNQKHIDLYLAHRKMRDSMGNSEQELAEYSRLGKEIDAARKEAEAQGAVARKLWEKKNKIPDKTREKVAAILRKESAKMAEEISPAFAEQFKLTEKDIAEFVKRDYSLVVAGNSTEADKKIRQKSLAFMATAANPEFHNLALKSAIHYQDGVRANAKNGILTEKLGKLLDSGVPAKEAIFQSRVPSHSTFAPGDEVRVYVHEMGHQLEFGSREAAEYAGDFLRRRTSGDELVSFADRFGAHYRQDERGSDDEFGKAIQSVFASTYGKTGSDMLANYAGKIYSDGSTEVLSVGLELFHENPKAFAEADPEWFDLVTGVLTGRVLKQTKQEVKAKYQ